MEGATDKGADTGMDVLEHEWSSSISSRPPLCGRIVCLDDIKEMRTDLQVET